MKNLLLASTFVLALPLAAFAQSSTGGSMSNPTTPSLPSSSMGSGTAKIAAPGNTMTTHSMTSPTSVTELSAMDRKFILAAAIGGIAEVNDGKLAAQMGDDAVKRIGSRMVSDHGKANDQLAMLSQQLGDPAPTQTDGKHMQVSESLKTKSGAAFDVAYLQTELKSHEKTIALFKKEASSGSNQKLISFARNTLPILEEHLSMVENAQQS